MALTLLGFLSGYLVIGYILFYQGLSYIQRLPAVGGLLGERILYLIFFFVFVMLAVSNAAVQYGSLFRSRETGWLLTLPIDHRALYLWKFLESLVISSWGFLFISAPLLMAYAAQHNAPWPFYAKAFLLIIPFVAIPAAISAWLLVGLVRYARRSWLRVAAIFFVLIVITYVYRRVTAAPLDEIAGGNIVFALNEALRHTQISIHPLLPSTWWTESLIQWVKGLERPALFNALLILSNALMALLVTFAAAGRSFYPAWNRIQLRGARRRRRARAPSEGDSLEVRSGSHGTFAGGNVTAPPRPGVSLRRSTRALMLKDVREFTRETAQWIQVAVILGLLLIYTLNVRNLGYDITSPFWISVVSLLNLTVCALALSTLTTRFVFPQFSIEGRRLWIVGMAPFRLNVVLLQKLVLNLAFTASAALILILVSGLMLELPWRRIALYLAAIALMSFGLNALAISLGALFPNFEETDPAKVVSGFGGTLCLIASFIYLTLFMGVLTAASATEWLPAGGSAGGALPFYQWTFAGLSALVLTGIFGGIPLFLAINRVKRLELLGKL